MTKDEIMGKTLAGDELQSSLTHLDGERFCTDCQPARHRLEWFTEVVGKEYANVEITPPKVEKLYNDMLLYPWREGVRLSPIRSNPCAMERLRQEPSDVTHDCYFAVVLTSGQYKLQQGNREVYLRPGEMSLYDATQPHRIEMPKRFSKILISIPRHILDDRVSNVRDLTATRIPSNTGVGAVTSSMIQNIVKHLGEFEKDEFLELTDHVLDMFSLSINQVNRGSANLSRHRELTLNRVKRYINRNLCDPDLEPTNIAQGTGLSVRYINHLFSDENTSMMRYLTRQRLQVCRRYLKSSQYKGLPISGIAMRCGFKNMAHFSRTFKQVYGVAPREYRAGR